MKHSPLFQILIEHNALLVYINNTSGHQNIGEPLGVAFAWRASPEGHEFWANLSTLVLEACKNTSEYSGFNSYD